MPVQSPYNPNSRRIEEMIQSDWAKVGVKAKIVSYEWGEYLSGMRKGEHDSALFGWMSDNGDPDNFADVLLGCNSIKTGSNAARWCDKGYDSLVQKAKLTSNPCEALWPGAGDFLPAGAVDRTGKRQNVLCDPQQRDRVQREPDGQ